jgi:RNA polymerase sigma-54 factor
MATGMELRQDLQLTQSQKLVMTQKLQQSLEMLQLPSLELEKLIEQELRENPLLEDRAEEPSRDETPDAPDQTGEDSEESQRSDINEEDPLDILRQIDENDGYRDSTTRSGDDSWRPEIVSVPTLSEHLLPQIYTASLSPDLEIAATYVIYSLDRHGLLTLSREELLAGWDDSPDLLDKAVRIVRDLEPPGIGSSCVEEVLARQLRDLGLGEDSLAYRIVTRHFASMAEKKLLKIAKAESASPKQVQDAVEVISGLNPWPGNEFSTDSNFTIIPDVIIEQVEGKYMAMLNENRFRRLTISARNRRILESPATPDVEKEYVRDRFRKASWFIRAISQRQETVLKIATFLTDYQEGFFEDGIEGLKPLTLQQIADSLGYNQSTISRAINGKFVQSPRGIHEMRFFFSRKLSGSDGNMSTRIVKEELRRLIEAEDPGSPFSDEKLAAMLLGRGMNVKRRTVANYRTELLIPSARKRRRF